MIVHFSIHTIVLVACTKGAMESRLGVRNAASFSTGSPTGNANLNPDTLLTLKEKRKGGRTKRSFFLSPPLPLGNFDCASAGKSLSLHNRWQRLPFFSSHPNHELSVFICMSLCTRGWNVGMEGRKKVALHPMRDCDKALWAVVRGPPSSLSV